MWTLRDSLWTWMRKKSDKQEVLGWWIYCNDRREREVRHGEKEVYILIYQPSGIWGDWQEVSWLWLLVTACRMNAHHCIVCFQLGKKKRNATSIKNVQQKNIFTFSLSYHLIEERKQSRHQSVQSISFCCHLLKSHFTAPPTFVSHTDI